MNTRKQSRDKAKGPASKPRLFKSGDEGVRQPLEFFDCDVMVGSTLKATIAGFDAGELANELDRCGIARALVYANAIGPDAHACQNRIAADVSLANPRFAACCVLPQFPANRGQRVSSLVKDLLDKGARCFRLDREIGPASGALELEGFSGAAAVWRLLERKKIPVLIPGAHLPVSDGRFAYDLRDVQGFCRRYPALPVVLVNCPYHLERQLFQALAGSPNLYLTVTRLGLFGQLESLVAEFGAKRFLFGSGLPWNDPAIARGAVTYSGLTHGEKQLIAAGNLNRLLRNP